MDVAATWVSTLASIFILCIVVRILMSWVTIAPVRPWSRRIVGFFHDTTDWYLGWFRRVIPPIGPLDLSPIVAILVVLIAERLVTRLLLGIG